MWIRFIKDYYYMGDLMFEKDDVWMCATEQKANKFVNEGYAIHVTLKIVE